MLLAKLRLELEGHTDSVTAAEVTPDGRRALSASEDRTLRIWDLENGQTLRTLEGHTRRVNFVGVTVDGRRAVSASSDQTLRLWDLENGKDIFTSDGRISSCAVLPDGRTIVAADEASQMHFLRLIEAGETKLLPEVKIQLLIREDQS